MLKIISLGSAASWSDKTRKHFSLIIERNNKRIWIDPAVPYDKEVDFIILTQADEDHYHALNSYLKKFPDTIVYSSAGILRHIGKRLVNFRPIKKSFRWNGVSINIFSVPPMVGVPAIGIRLRYHDKKIAIIPEFDRLSKAEENLIKNAIWIVGIGEYDKRKPKDHKSTFEELMELAKRLQPKSIYITNLRINTYKNHKSDILRRINEYGGGILSDKSELVIKSKRYHRGLYLVKPHAFLIYAGLKTIILKNRKFEINGETLLLVDNNYAYGYLILAKPFKIASWSEFMKYSDNHLVTRSEFEKWNWDFPLWAYKIEEFTPFVEPRRVELPHGVQTFVLEAEKYIITEKLHPEEFTSEGIDSDMKNIKSRWRECLADLRYLGNSAYPRLKAGKRWGDWSIDLVLRYFAKLVDVLRSVYFPIIPPTMKDLYKMYTKKNPDEAMKSSYWKCYKESEKYMKSKPPSSIEEAREWDEKRKEKIITKSKVQKKYWSTAKPYYRFELPQIIDELKNIGWLDKKLLVDIKADGLRLTLGKSGDEPFAYVDPETLKQKSPDVSKRLPLIMDEIRDTFPPNTIVDGEFIAVSRDGKEILHRTIANSLLNAKTVPPEKLADFAHIFVFDCLFYNGEDIRKYPLHERLEYLQRIKSTKHIWIERTSGSLEKSADGYLVSSGEKLLKAINKIINHKINRPKFIAEGVMIKDMGHVYEFPINHGWGKAKKYYEFDGRVLDIHLVRGAKRTFNYWIGCDIPKDYYDVLINMRTKDWYHSVGVLAGKKFYRGKDSIGKKGKYVMILGKTDNTNVRAEVGDIIRIAAEEFLKYDNKEHPNYPRFAFYIGLVLEQIPEKNVTDNLSLLEKLSEFQPKRIPIEEIIHIEGESEKSNLNLGDLIILHDNVYEIIYIKDGNSHG